MFTEYTYQDWLAAQDKAAFALSAIRAYKSSEFYKKACQADDYEVGLNTYIRDIKPIRFSNHKEIYLHRVPSNVFKRLVIQLVQYLLGNGVTINDNASQEYFEFGFDKTLVDIGKCALKHGVGYGFLNVNKLENFRAARGKRSGYFPLLDERTGFSMVGIRFWQISDTKPLFFQIFELDGMTEYVVNGNEPKVVRDKVPYTRDVWVDGTGETVKEIRNYKVLPIIPFYGNDRRESELSENIKSKIDAYDEMLSRYVTFLNRSSMIYWLINNTGGSAEEIKTMVDELEALGIAATDNETISATPQVLNLPADSRQIILDKLESDIYKDFMALNMDTITGGSLTTTAIKTATANLDSRANDLEWQAFQFMQKVLALKNESTEQIQFKRQTIANDLEIMTMIYQCRADIDQKTALTKNPLIDQDEVEGIMQASKIEQVQGLIAAEKLEEEMNNALSEES